MRFRSITIGYSLQKPDSIFNRDLNAWQWHGRFPATWHWPRMPLRRPFVFTLGFRVRIYSSTALTELLICQVEITTKDSVALFWLPTPQAYILSTLVYAWEVATPPYMIVPRALIVQFRALGNSTWGIFKVYRECLALLTRVQTTSEKGVFYWLGTISRTANRGWPTFLPCGRSEFALPSRYVRKGWG